MTTAIEDIPITLAFIYDDMKDLKRKITRGKECYTRLKGLVKGLNKLIPITMNSPVILVEMEEQIEHMKMLIRAKREQINTDVALWYNLNEWKTELMHQIDSSS